MNEQFKVGDICVGHGIALSAEFNGMECEIIEGLQLKRGRGNKTGEDLGLVEIYTVRWANGVVIGARQCHLRRRKPPTTGEQSVMGMFKAPPLRLVEPPPERRISAGWMRDYDRAQALMAAGVKVERVWPVLVEGAKP